MSRDHEKQNIATEQSNYLMACDSVVLATASIIQKRIIVIIHHRFRRSPHRRHQKSTRRLVPWFQFIIIQDSRKTERRRLVNSFSFVDLMYYMEERDPNNNSPLCRQEILGSLIIFILDFAHTLSCPSHFLLPN